MIIFIQKKIKRLDEVSWPQISITSTNTGLLIILKDESVECIVCVFLPLQSHQPEIMKTKKVIIL